MFVAGVVLVYPSLIQDLLGLGLFGVVFLLQHFWQGSFAGSTSNRRLIRPELCRTGEQKTANEQLQPLTVSFVDAKKLDADAIPYNVAHHGRVHGYGKRVLRELQLHLNNGVLRQPGIGM